jgi:hypothetical protein
MDQRLARVTRAAPLLAALLLCSVMAPGASAHATAAQHRPAPAATMRDATAGAVTNTTAAEHVEPSSFAYGRFGAVQLFRPSGSPTSVTLLLAGDAGWDATLGALADALVGHGSVVVGIDGQRYLEAIDQPGDGCLFIGFDFEDLSHAVQRRLGLRDYLVPVLAGAGNGAALAAIVAAQSPQGTYAGLLSVAFRPELALRREPCGAPGLAWRVQPGAAPARGTAAATATSTSSAAAIVAATGTGPDAAAGGLLLQPAARRSTPWVMLQDVGDSAFTLQAARRFAAASAATTVVPLRRIGTGASEGARAGAALGSGATAADPGTLGAALARGATVVGHECRAARTRFARRPRRPAAARSSGNREHEPGCDRGARSIRGAAHRRRWLGRPRPGGRRDARARRRAGGGAQFTEILLAEARARGRGARPAAHRRALRRRMAAASCGAGRVFVRRQRAALPVSAPARHDSSPGAIGDAAGAGTRGAVRVPCQQLAAGGAVRAARPCDRRSRPWAACACSASTRSRKGRRLARRRDCPASWTSHSAAATTSAATTRGSRRASCRRASHRHALSDPWPRCTRRRT